MVDDLSNLAEGSLTGKMGSMSATNTVSSRPPFQGPPIPSESVLESEIRPEPQPIPPVAPAHTAGVGDKGGVLHGEGSSPWDGFGWDNVSEGPDTDRWTKSRQPFDPTDI